jgi:hypothetical protein
MFIYDIIFYFSILLHWCITRLSFPSMMQHKLFAVSPLFWNVIKIIFNCNLFQPYKANCRQLFTNWNCRITPVPMSMHPMLLHIVVRTKMCLIENEYLSSSLRVIFILRRSCCTLSCVVLTSRPSIPCIYLWCNNLNLSVLLSSKQRKHPYWTCAINIHFQWRNWNRAMSSKGVGFSFQRGSTFPFLSDAAADSKTPVSSSLPLRR